MKRIAIVVTIVLAVVVAGALYTKYRIAPKVAFSTIELTDVDGRPFNMEATKGKKVFINFFATWCGPCMHEMPLLEQAQQKLNSQNFIFLCIADEPADRLKSLQNRVPGLTILHSAQKLNSINIVTYPTNYLLNTSGEIVFKTTGVLNWKDEQTIKQLQGYN